MHQDQGKAPVEFERLLGTVVSGIDLGDDRVLEVKGNDRDGQAAWRLRIGGSARFTFSHSSEQGCWLVETNFDAGAAIRSSDRAMMRAICGAVVDCVRSEKEGLFIHSADGRGIEIPYALNENGVTLDILPHGDRPVASRITLPGETAAA